MTSGHVASNTRSPRASASARTARETPCAENTTVLPGGTSCELLDEHRAFRLQVVDDELVVDDLVAHVDRRAELRERLLDDRDRAVDAGAEAARVREDDVHQFPLSDGTRGRIDGAPLAEAVDDQQRGADADRAVGDVERGPRPAFVVEQQEVDDAPDREAVPEIAERAAQDQREAETVRSRCRRASGARR